MNISLPAVRLPSRRGLLFMGGVGALSAVGVLSSPLAIVLGAAPLVMANIPEEEAAGQRSVSAGVRTSSSTSRSRAGRGSAARSGGGRTTRGASAGGGRRRVGSTSRRGRRASGGTSSGTATTN